MSNLFFPKDVQKKVRILYAWVRVADDYVDAIPQQKKAFYQFRKDFVDTWGGKKTNKVQNDFVKLAKQYKFEKKWLKAFLDAMEMDLTKKTYTFKELCIYMYGSAEVIGLMMSRIMSLDKRLDPYAQALGRSMQLANFIRDQKEDATFGRKYLKEPQLFYIKKVYEWDTYARKSFAFIPYRYRIAIKTAQDMYIWTIKRIQKDPTLPMRKKLKPTKLRIILKGIHNAITQWNQTKDQKEIRTVLKA